MAQSFTSDDLKALALFPFQDVQWKNKFLIGSLVIFSAFAVPILPYFFLYGYMAQIMHHIIVNKGEPHLPEWSDWGKLFMDGAKLFGAMLVYTLPIIAISFASMFIMFVAMWLFGAALANAEYREQEVSALVALIPVIGTLGMMALWALIMIFSLLLGIVLPAIMGHVVATNEFAAAFRLKEWWSIFKVNIVGFILAYIMVMAIGMIVGFGLYFLYFTIIFCCLLPFLMPPVMLYFMAVQGAFYAQAYRDGVTLLNQP